LQRRITEMERRVAEGKAQRSIKAEDLAARKADVQELKLKLAALSAPVAPPAGNFFRYELQQVRESLGASASAVQRLNVYYKRVNDHNREVFKDLKPPAVAKGEASYTGDAECADCHDEEATFWAGTGHAKAYKTLSDQFKEFNLDCVSCHVTGYDQPGGSTVTHVDNLKNVQCEACHGPGSLHAEDPEAKNLIRLEPPRDLCVKCHHPPHVHEGWDVEAAWKHIVGPGHGGG
jgi:hypothetical protein